MDGKTFELKSLCSLDESLELHEDVWEELTANDLETDKKVSDNQQPEVYEDVWQVLSGIDLETDKQVSDNQQPGVQGKEIESYHGMGSVSRFLRSVSAHMASLARRRVRKDDQA